MFTNPGDDQIRQILMQSKTIAIVGLSDKPHRDSYMVAQYMIDNGYKIIPVNPRAKEVLNQKAYTSLLEVPGKIDIVNVFRRSDLVLPVVEEALTKKPGTIWLQLGIENEECAKLAALQGIAMIMDKCIKVEHQRLIKNGQ
ncbi:CoA-binding protein [Desulfotruncus alcoholivorax]|uniref:CoA-binding protein n=1 Tax=Desulfotruncus alcoholivorax TaxID=265477 RepID=UPI000420F1D0|nr:CoA-binding protein [Desulfotruncus alcoholivorax]